MAEITRKTDISIEIAWLERSKHRRVTSVAFAIKGQTVSTVTELVKPIPFLLVCLISSRTRNYLGKDPLSIKARARRSNIGSYPGIVIRVAGIASSLQASRVP
jgi:hypothetical protein